MGSTRAESAPWSLQGAPAGSGRLPKLSLGSSRKDVVYPRPRRGYRTISISRTPAPFLDHFYLTCGKMAIFSSLYQILSAKTSIRRPSLTFAVTQNTLILSVSNTSVRCGQGERPLLVPGKHGHRRRSPGKVSTLSVSPVKAGGQVHPGAATQRLCWRGDCVTYVVNNLRTVTSRQRSRRRLGAGPRGHGLSTAALSTPRSSEDTCTSADTSVCRRDTPRRAAPNVGVCLDLTRALRRPL